MWHEHFIAFDTETSGLDGSARILELAVVEFRKGEVVDVFESCFLPPDFDFDDPKVQGALQINGLTREKLAGAPTFERAWDDLWEVMKECRVWVAHNTPFDLRMLRYELGRMKRELEVPEFLLDTKALDQRINPGRDGRRLSDVTRRWGVQMEDAHHAQVDAAACGLVLAEMIKAGKLPIDDEGMLRWMGSPSTPIRPHTWAAGQAFRRQA